MLPPLLYTPTKRKLHQTDPFFELGNIEARAAWLHKQVRHHSHNPDRNPNHNQAHGSATAVDNYTLITEEVERLQSKHVTCHLPPCSHQRRPPIFPSTAAYELHYDAAHSHVCSACDAVFPGERWLRLHLAENHDTLRQLRRERGEKTFACFLETCPKLFLTPRTRRLHLVDKHRYPRSFQFSLVRSGTIPYEVRLKQRRERAMAKRRREKVGSDLTKMDEDEDQDGGDGEDVDDASGSVISRNEAAASSPAGTDVTTDMDLDAVTARMSRLRVAAPMSVSFGRGARNAGWFEGGRGGGQGFGQRGRRRNSGNGDTRGGVRADSKNRKMETGDDGGGGETRPAPSGMNRQERRRRKREGKEAVEDVDAESVGVGMDMGNMEVEGSG